MKNKTRRILVCIMTFIIVFSFVFDKGLMNYYINAEENTYISNSDADGRANVSNVDTASDTNATEDINKDGNKEISAENPQEISADKFYEKEDKNSINGKNNNEKINEENIKESTEKEKNDKSGTIEKSEESAKSQNEHSKESSDNSPKDKEEMEEGVNIKTFDHLYEGVSIEGLDFSSCELLIAASDPSIFTADTEVVSEYKGVYLTRYPDVDQTKAAYTYYFTKAIFVDTNSSIAASEGKTVPEENTAQDEKTVPEEKDSSDENNVSSTSNDGHGEADLSDINNGDDALSIINDISVADYSGCIALIDTGASTPNVVKAVSVLGGTVNDDNGHGTRMADAIADANPDAKIISIKALNESAVGNVSDVYAAIQYAINANVSVINLSMSSTMTAESEVLEKAIEEAKKAGIMVVASAGNRGCDASFFTPGNIRDVLTIGSADESGKRTDISNYGSEVDYYVVSDSTSVAAAKFSAYLLSDGLDKIKDRADVFSADELEGSDAIEEPGESASETDANKEADANEKPTDANKEGWEKVTDDKLELVAAVYASATDVFPLHININTTINGNALNTRSAFNSYLSGTSFTVTESPFNTSDYSYELVDNGSVYCVSGHKYANPFLYGDAYNVSKTLTLYSVDGDVATYILTPEYGYVNFVVRPFSSNYQLSGITVRIRGSKAEDSYIRFKKVLNATGNAMANVWFAVYGIESNGSYALMGFTRTSSSGVASKIYTEPTASDDKLINDTGGFKKSQIEKYGSRFYLRELGTLSGTTFTNPVNNSQTVSLSTVNGSATGKVSSSFGSSWFACAKEHSIHIVTTMSHSTWDAGSYSAIRGYDNISDARNGNNPEKCYNGNTVGDGAPKYISLKKLDESTGNALKGFTFKFYDKDDNLLGEAETDKNGYAYLVYELTQDLFPITAYETDAPRPYNEIKGNVWSGSHSSGFGTKVVWSSSAQAKDGDGKYFNTKASSRTKSKLAKNRYGSAYFIKKIDGTTGEEVDLSGANSSLFRFFIKSTDIKADERASMTKARRDELEALEAKYGSYGYMLRIDSTDDDVTNTFGYTMNKTPEGWYVYFNVPEGVTLYVIENGGIATNLGFDTGIVPVVNGSKKDIYSTASIYNPDYANESTYDPNEYKKGYSFKTVSATSAGAEGATITIDDYKDIPVKVKKTVTTAYTSYVSGNPNYSLNGVTFTVYSDAACTKGIGNIKVTQAGNGTVTSSTLNISADNFTKNSNGICQKTTFYYKETAGGKNYNILTSSGSFTVDPKNSITEFSVANTPKTNPLDIKLVKEGNDGKPTGVRTLEGAQFTVNFYPQDISGNFNASASAAKTWVFGTKYNSTTKKYEISFNKNYLLSGSNDFFDAAGKLDLPLGFVTVKETKAPTGYKLSGKFSVKGDSAAVVSNSDTLLLRINADNTESSYINGSYVKVSSIEKSNVPIRADIEFVKVNEDDGKMEGVEFLLTNTDTGEKVTLVTDENGFVSTASSYAAHSKNTNITGKGNGVWFGDLSEIDDTLGALNYGNYTLKELRTESNKGHQLEKSFVITKETIEANDGRVFKVYDKTALATDDKIWNFHNPAIKTTATVKETGSKMLAQFSADFDINSQTIVDEISYINLRENTDYTLLTELMEVDADGNVRPYEREGYSYISTHHFKTGNTHNKSIYEKSGTEVIEIPDVDPLNDHIRNHFVVYQTLYLGVYDTVEALQRDIDSGNIKTRYDEYTEDDDMDFFPLEHKDFENKDQTVTGIIIHTTAEDNVSEDHIAFGENPRIIKDKVYYSGLEVGKEYTVEGVLHVKPGQTWQVVRHDSDDSNADADGNVYTSEDENEDTGEYVLKDEKGNPVTAAKTFTPETEEGYVELEFSVAANELRGRSVVAFETLKYNDIILAVHANINDEDQILHFPNFKTTSRNSNVKEILEGKEDSAKEVPALKDKSSITDTIHYHNLLANRKYMARGTLMDKVTGEAMVDATGKTITGEVVFDTKKVPPAENTKSPYTPNWVLPDGTIIDMSEDLADYMCDGDVDVLFEGYDITNLANKVGVVFEEIYLIKEDGREILVGEHKDIEDIDQFISFVEVHTNAKDKTTDISVVPENKLTSILDTVSYKNVIPGKIYKLKATLHVSGDKSKKYKDGDILRDKDGNEISVEYEFVPENSEGEAVVEIPIDTVDLPRNINIVVFEDMFNEYGILVASHSDLSDKDQTIRVPDGRTTAHGKNTGKHTVGEKEKATIVDTVMYENLEPGKEYTLTGVVYNKQTEKPLIVGGGKVTNTMTFTPEVENGEVDIEFTFDSTKLNGESLVLYEDVYYMQPGSSELIKVFQHHDINNTDQTVTVEKNIKEKGVKKKIEKNKNSKEKIIKDKVSKEKSTKVKKISESKEKAPKTGMALFFILLLILCTSGAGMILFSRKNKNDSVHTKDS